MYPNEPTGFRGIPWGTDISERADMVPRNRIKTEHFFYVRKGEQMEFGGAHVRIIGYRTYDHRLDGGIVDLVGKENQAALMKTLEGRYGTAPARLPGRRDWGFGDETSISYLWDGKTTRIYVTCTEHHECSILMGAMDMLRKEKRLGVRLAKGIPPICQKQQSPAHKK
ncbi:MAG: hypothetical protein P8090_12515 [Gammaproteobacteria bacterium]